MACNYLPLFLPCDSYAERKDICRSFSELNLIDNNNIGVVSFHDEVLLTKRLFSSSEHSN
jgi:hypothetical protein